MDQSREEAARETADRVVEFAEELEASGEARMDQDALAAARAALHAWIDSAVGVVVTPALGRVTVIHGQGRESTISSPELPFLMTAPLGEGAKG